MRCTATNLLAAFCERTDQDLSDYVDMLLQRLLVRFNDHDEVCVCVHICLDRRLVHVLSSVIGRPAVYSIFLI